MNNIQKRFIIFLLLCIPSRLFLIYLAKNVNKKTLNQLGYISLIPAIGFMYIYITKSRTTGIETLGDKIWWNDLRPIHSILYFSFSYMAINNNKDSYKVLLLDVIIGLISFILYHKSQGNFNKLL